MYRVAPRVRRIRISLRAEQPALETMSDDWDRPTAVFKLVLAEPGWSSVAQRRLFRTDQRHFAPRETVNVTFAEVMFWN